MPSRWVVLLAPTQIVQLPFCILEQLFVFVEEGGIALFASLMDVEVFVDDVLHDVDLTTQLSVLGIRLTLNFLFLFRQ
jgi:hypothetical protein